MKSHLFIYFFLVGIIPFTSCRSNKDTANQSVVVKNASPPVYIYKTRADYFLHVPVTLSDDKTGLVSYPAPGDLFFKGDLAYPVKLEDGFLLDRRGIVPNSAFTKWTYYEYSNLKASPDQAEIMKMMLDTDPFTTLYYCGQQRDFADLVTELNQTIIENRLASFKKLK